MAKITTKYSIGQTVYLIENNIVKMGTVQKIQTSSWKDTAFINPLQTKINYEIAGFGLMAEDNIFSSKAALLRSL